MEFGPYKILTSDQRHMSFRYADEVLYALGMYLMSLEPPKNPDVTPPALFARGREIFRRETRISLSLSARLHKSDPDLRHQPTIRTIAHREHTLKPILP
jgi:hypothetical protein